MNARVWTKFGFVLVMTLLVGCGEATDSVDEPLDPENESFGIDGKGDSLGLSQDEIDKILAIANSYSEEELDAFLNSRAARNIIYTRNRRGSFQTIAELDDVAYVGRSALEAFRVEARSFEGIQVVTDPSEMVDVHEVEGRFSSLFQLEFHGQLADELRAQPGVEPALNCNEATGSCTFTYRFEDLNDYTDRAGAGHVAASFRSDEAENSRFRDFARNVERFGNDGPMQCVQVENPPHCVSIYGNSCSTPYRCSVRLPDPDASAPVEEPRTEPVVASELVRVDATDHGLKVVVMGYVADELRSRPVTDSQLVCDGGECAFRARFEKVNDYTDRAQAGHIAASFRTDEVESGFDSFRRMASEIERLGIDGPLECDRVDTHCVSVYGNTCHQHYRCGIRL